MHILLLFVCLLVEILKTCDCRVRIIGGQPVQIKEYPYMFAILYKPGRLFCGGSLIGRKHILTAAHCFNQRVNYILDTNIVYAVGGDVNRYETENSKHRITKDIEFAVIHPKFDINIFYNDICILQLVEEVDLNAYVNIIHIAEKVPAAYSNCTVLGWGATYEDDIYGSDKLLRTMISIIPFEKCNAIKDLQPMNEAMMICAGVAAGGKDSCQGDSGGPLICHGKQVGIVSYGADGCGKPGMYGVYTKAPSYRDWIDSIKRWDGSARSLRGGLLRLRKKAGTISTNKNDSVLTFVMCVLSFGIGLFQKM